MKRNFGLGISLAILLVGNTVWATTYNLTADTTLTGNDAACTSINLNGFTLNLAGYNLTTTGMTAGTGTIANTGTSASTVTLNIPSGATNGLKWVWNGNINIVTEGTFKRLDFRSASPNLSGSVTINSTGEANAGYGTMIYYQQPTPFGTAVLNINQNTQLFAGTDTTLSNNFVVTAGKVLSVTRENPVHLAGAITGSGTLRMDGSSNAKDGTLSGTAANTVSLEVQKGNIFLAKTGVNAAGNLTISGGTVKVTGTGNNQIADSGTISLSGGTFDLNGTSETVAGLNGTGGTISNTNGTTATAITLSGAGTYSSAATIAGGTKGITLTKTGTGTQTFSGSAANTNTNLVVNAGIVELGKTAIAVNNLTIANGATVNYTSTNENQIAGTLTMNGGTLDLNGISETVSTLNGTGAAINNGTLVITNKEGYLAISGSGKMVFNTTGRMDFRAGSTNTGGMEFRSDTNTSGKDNGFWLTGNANGSTTKFDPLGTGLVTISGNSVFQNLGYGNMIAIGNKFQINADKTLTLNLTASGGGFTLIDTISGDGTLKITGAAIDTVVLSGASTFAGGIAQNAGTLYADNGSFGTLNVSGGTFSPGTAAKEIGKITLTSAALSGTTDSGKIIIDVHDNAGTLEFDTLIFSNAGTTFDMADGSLLFAFDNIEIDDNTALKVNFLEGLTLAAGDYSSWLDSSLADFRLMADGNGNLLFGSTSGVPEPASWLLLLMGVVGVHHFCGKRKLTSSPNHTGRSDNRSFPELPS